MNIRGPLVTVAAAVTVAALAAPAGAQEPEGIAEFETTGSGLKIDAPTELDTMPSLVPDREDFAFLGDPGELVWIAGTVDGSTFPTLDATDVDADLEVELEKTGGPGDAWLYTFGGPGLAEPLAATADDRTFDLQAGTTTFVVLAVNEPGQYTLDLKAREGNGADGYAPTTNHGAHAQSGGATAVATYSVTAEDATVEEVNMTLADDGDTSSGGGQAAPSCEIIDSGHVDIGPRFVDGEWRVQVRDDRGSEPVWRELADVVLHVPDAAIFPIPEGDDFSFLGQTGDEIWMLPQVQQGDIVWPGWNTQDSSVIDGVPGAVDWNLVDVNGPGAYTLFLTGTFGGADILFDSAESLPQTLSVPRNTHAHGNWTFSEAGVYQLTVEFAATTSDGEAVSDTKDIQLAIGDQTDPVDACVAGSGGGSGTGGGDDEDGGGWLPTTGAGWLALAGAAALAAVLIGGLIMLLTRKRKRAAEPEAPDADQ